MYFFLSHLAVANPQRKSEGSRSDEAGGPEVDVRDIGFEGTSTYERGVDGSDESDIALCVL